MKIKSAQFVASATRPGNYPLADLPEIAFAGRSNVGKSSLINTILRRKKLVKTGATPGRTQLLNFFNINGQIVFVDLPGYGYAKVSKSLRKTWASMIETYLKSRETLRGVVMILDIRRTPGPAERESLGWFNVHNIPLLLVATKADKFSKQKQVLRKKEIARALAVPVDAIIVFSAKTGLGRDDVWESILDLCEIKEDTNKNG